VGEVRIVEEGIETAKQLMIGLLERMEINAELIGSLMGRDIYLEIRGDREGILIGRHGRILDSLQFLVNRMVNKRLKEPVKVILDINDYRKKRGENLKKMAIRSGEKAKLRGFSLTIGPFNAYDRRIIHLALKEDPFLRTESLGEGEMKRIKIIPSEKEGARV
jgi:spoIIIJ-associated protein